MAGVSISDVRVTNQRYGADLYIESVVSIFVDQCGETWQYKAIACLQRSSYQRTFSQEIIGSASGTIYKMSIPPLYIDPEGHEMLIPPDKNVFVFRGNFEEVQELAIKKLSEQVRKMSELAYQTAVDYAYS